MKVITLCGSTKFKKEFEQANRYLTLKGNIVISLAFLSKAKELRLPRNRQNYLEKSIFVKLICQMKYL